jgi:hypothetical protein
MALWLTACGHGIAEDSELNEESELLDSLEELELMLLSEELESLE